MNWTESAKPEDTTGDLENRLWATANQLWANATLRPSEFSPVVLGLIFLRFADVRFTEVDEKLKPASGGEGGSRRRRITPASYHAEGVLYLPGESRFSTLLKLTEGDNLGQAVNDAMRAIERENPDLADVLPKTYHILENRTLAELLKVMAFIPMDRGGDTFGLIYEYFLGKFAMSEGRKGGEFYTPTSIVRLIVGILEPYHGRILDPACGSGGMFVQSARFVENHHASPTSEISIHGQERVTETSRLARLNLGVHGLGGDIRQGNTYYEDLHCSVEQPSPRPSPKGRGSSDLFAASGRGNSALPSTSGRGAGGEGHKVEGASGRFDFVMANPPFNVSKVDKERIADDPRYPFGIPRTDNANYLWIQHFHSSLNGSGRAGFVMANSASDARSSEQDIRRKLIETGHVDVMVSIGSNFFFTVTLPCTLWFFDKGKTGTPREDTVLFLDARHIFRQLDRAHRDFTPAQLEFLANIVRFYRGIDLEFDHGSEQKWAEVFGDALEYQDVPGLCKTATRAEIEAQGWSLNPGRYVGVAKGEELSDEDFKEKLEALNEELEVLNGEAHELEERIAENVTGILEAT